MPIWPSDLPQQPLVDGYEESTPSTLVRTKMDKGPDKVRRRTTTGVRRFSMQMLLDGSQTDTLESFLENDLNGGELSFDYQNPRLSGGITFRRVVSGDFRTTADGSRRTIFSTDTPVRKFRFIPFGDDALVRYNALGADFYRVQFQLEILPGT